MSVTHYNSTSDWVSPMTDAIGGGRARRLLRTKDAAHSLSMSPWNLRQLVSRREIAYISSGDHTSAWRFDIRET